MSRDREFPAKLHVRPAKSQILISPRCQSEDALGPLATTGFHAKPLVRLRGNADAQADLSLR